MSQPSRRFGVAAAAGSAPRKKLRMIDFTASVHPRRGTSTGSENMCPRVGHFGH